MFYNVKIFKTNMLMPYWCRFHSGKLTVDLCFLEELIQIQAEQPFHQGYQVLIKFIKAFWKKHFFKCLRYIFFSLSERTHQDCSGDCAISGEKKELLATNCWEKWIIYHPALCAKELTILRIIHSNIKNHSFIQLKNVGWSRIALLEKNCFKGSFFIYNIVVDL